MQREIESVPDDLKYRNLIPSTITITEMPYLIVFGKLYVGLKKNVMPKLPCSKRDISSLEKFSIPSASMFRHRSVANNKQSSSYKLLKKKKRNKNQRLKSSKSLIVKCSLPLILAYFQHPKWHECDML